MADNQRATPVAAAGQDRVESPCVSISNQGAAGLVTLGRASGASGLTAAARGQVAAAFLRFARDPNTYAVVIQSAEPATFLCGNPTDDASWLRDQTAAARRNEIASRLALVWQLECFSKPTLSLIDGRVSGAGISLSLNGTHRVSGPGYAFDLAEMVFGTFPGYGSAFHLARMPDDIGLYLGLTGRRIGPADAFALGLVTQCAAADAALAIVAGVADARPVDPLLAGVHRSPGAPPLDAHRELIRRCFAGRTVEDIVQRLTSEVRRSSAGAEFASGVLADLAARLPFALKITFRHIREAAALDLRHVLIRDYRLTLACLDSGDLRDAGASPDALAKRPPQWQRADLEDVSDARVGRCFEPRPEDELVLPIRREMQAARV